jgi:FtsZ-binding cell division protein ZapB
MAETENEQPKPAEEKPETPWGNDFDPERAWKLVTNLRTELAELKTENGTLKTERQARKDDGKDDLTKLQERLQAAEKAAKDSERALYLERVLRKHPALEDFADLLTGENEEEISAKADRLAAIGKPKEPADGEKPPAEIGEQKPAEEAELPGKPEPALTPGHGGAETTPFDPAAIAKAARQ